MKMHVYTLTACTTMNHLLEMTHHPETLDSARSWAEELVSLPCIRHVIISKNEWINVVTLFRDDQEDVEYVPGSGNLLHPGFGN